MRNRSTQVLNSILCSPLGSKCISSAAPRASSNSIRLYHFHQALQSHSFPGTSKTLHNEILPAVSQPQSTRLLSSKHNGTQEKASSSSSDSKISQRKTDLDTRIEHLLSRLTTHSRTILNTYTGYSLVESLNAATEAQSRRLNTLQTSARTASAAYPLAVTAHAATLREINDHQIRTRIRTSADAETLAALYKAENAAQAHVNETQQRAKEAEDATAEAGVVYRELIQKARHEEQLWRDRIQYWSTWGTVVLVGSNLLLWAVMEPWRRRRIVREIRGEIQSLREERGREEGGAAGGNTEIACPCGAGRSARG